MKGGAAFQTLEGSVVPGDFHAPVSSPGDPQSCRLSLEHPDQSSPFAGACEVSAEGGDGVACGFGPSLESMCGCWRSQSGERSKTGLPKELITCWLRHSPLLWGKTQIFFRNPQPCSHMSCAIPHTFPEQVGRIKTRHPLPRAAQPACPSQALLRQNIDCYTNLVQ